MLLLTFTKANLEISIYDSLTPELEIILKNGITAELQAAYIKLIEDSAQKDLTFRYVLVYSEDKKLIAFFYYQLLNFSRNNLNIKRNFFLRLLSDLLLRIRPFKILISGNLFAVNFPVVYYEKNYLTTTDIINMIMDAKDIYKCDVLMIKDLDKAFLPNEMLSRGFIKYETDLTMSLNIRKHWNSFDDYVNDLKKKYRKRALKVSEAGSSLIRQELNADQILSQSARIRELFLNVCNRQPIRMGQVDADYFFEYKKRFPEKFSFIGFYLNDKLVSFVTYVDHKEILEVHYIGIDYSCNATMMLYFNILFDGIEVAIRNHKEQLELGRTAREAKANLGAEPVYFNDYILYNSRLAKFLSGFISRQFEKSIGNLWELRSPFIKKNI